MTDLPDGLRDRATNAAFDAWSRNHVFAPGRETWRAVVDAVAEVVLAEHQPEGVAFKKKKIGKGSFKVPCTYGGQKITFRGHNEVDAHTKADAYERGYDDGLSQKNEYHYGLHSVQSEYRVYYLKGFSHGESLSIRSEQAPDG